MSASVHSINTVNRQAAGPLWREAYIEKLNTIMDALESRPSMKQLGDIYMKITRHQ